MQLGVPALHIYSLQLLAHFIIAMYACVAGYLGLPAKSASILYQAIGMP